MSLLFGVLCHFSVRGMALVWFGSNSATDSDSTQKPNNKKKREKEIEWQRQGNRESERERVSGNKRMKCSRHSATLLRDTHTYILTNTHMNCHTLALLRYISLCRITGFNINFTRFYPWISFHCVQLQHTHTHTHL